MGKGYFRPIDTAIFVVPEKRADSIDEKKLHEIWLIKLILRGLSEGVGVTYLSRG
jgi:hypothetical protein